MAICSPWRSKVAQSVGCVMQFSCYDGVSRLLNLMYSYGRKIRSDEVHLGLGLRAILKCTSS